MKILVTGATGFIGNYVVNELLKHNCDVIATSISSSETKTCSWLSKVTYIPCDLNFKKDNYYKTYPVFTNSFAQELIKLNIKILGMDTPSPDKSPFLIHKALFKKNILIIENLTNLEKLPKNKIFELIALPIKCKVDGAIARVIARI